MGKPVILVVDDEKSIRSAVSGILEDEGFVVRLAESGEKALDVLEKEIPDLVLLDIWLPGIDGLDTLTKMREKVPELGVIMISGHGTIDTAVRATKLGALNFIEKPLSLHRLLIEVQQALKQKALERENRELRMQIEMQYTMVGNSAVIQEIRRTIETAGPSNGRVLISGESGTGKELVAKAIHRASQRASAPFVEVNCAAIPDDLIESELFGHEKGAFTNATYQKKGKFELAHGGTLFLDEIGDMSLKTQSKVLRALEEGVIERVGSTRSIPIDVRIIAASNKNLLNEIEKNTFREDLFYRLNVIPIHMPPLREHSEDIPLLINHYLEYYCKEYGKPMKNILQDALQALKKYSWPGNVRELKNEIERLVIMTPLAVIKLDDLRDSLKQPTSQGNNDIEFTTQDDLKSAREKFEQKFILERLKEHNWNVTQTAQHLGIERSNLHRKLKQLGIQTGSNGSADARTN
ncbi:sigma-54-dependent Fis family transcriptional regulator [bacterium]|nr:sigma-54-dependent Fis family transcriptional regulator [candidate division CSSED10-310 bacterium]